MVNLRFELNSEPDRVYLTTPFMNGRRQVPLACATSRHIVMHLATVAVFPEEKRTRIDGYTLIGEDTCLVCQGKHRNYTGDKANSQSKLVTQTQTH